MLVYGTGMGDVDPPEGEEFDFDILDRRGRRATWLDRYINDETKETLLEDYLRMVEAEYYASY